MHLHDEQGRAIDEFGALLASNAPRVPKGVKLVLTERGLWRAGLKLKCAKAADHLDDSSCCAHRVMAIQPDFVAEKPAIQKLIESHGHLCVFLPKYHCELNIIEYFWGMAKRYARDHCDYKFASLVRAVPERLAAVPLVTIRRWEMRFWRYCEAYKRGLEHGDACAEVKKLHSRTKKMYKSHRRC
jgi:hypothetical protein